jgi:hypothetical protein
MPETLTPNYTNKNFINIPMAKRTRSYKLGAKIDDEHIYLCTCPKRQLHLMPWKTKKIFHRFSVYNGGVEVLCVHVCISKNEHEKWLEEETPSSKNGPKEKTLRWWQKRLIKVLRKRVKDLCKAEKEKAKSLQEPSMPIEPKPEKPKFEGPPITPPLIPDPDIEKYEYDLSVEIHGSIRMRTRDLFHIMEVGPGKFPARLDSEARVMLRYPKDTGQNEYGLYLRQLMQYQRGYSELATVIIHGLK